MGNKSLVRELFSIADIQICSFILFLSHKLKIPKKMNNQNGLFKVFGKVLMHNLKCLKKKKPKNQPQIQVRINLGKF